MLKTYIHGKDSSSLTLSAAKKQVICVDLDGTLIRNDITRMMLLRFFLRKPHLALHVLCWSLAFGWSYAKDRIAYQVDISSLYLDYNTYFIDWLLSMRAQGASLVLATASHEKYALQVARHWGFFDRVFASNAHYSLSGKKKRDILNKAFGEKNYIYCGNAFVDLPIWKSSSSVVVVNPPLFLLRRIQKNRLHILAKFFCYA